MKRPGDDDDPKEAHFNLLPHEESGGRADQNEDQKMIAEEESGRREKQKVELEYETPNTIKFIWLGTYFFFSLMLTLYNKLVLGSVRWPL
jgi:hypothetical protein